MEGDKIIGFVLKHQGARKVDLVQNIKLAKPFARPPHNGNM
jgi:hypothetical protein